MSQINERHRAKCGVEGKCSRPMWGGGMPSVFCDRPAFGQQYSEGTKHAPSWRSPRDRNRYLMWPAHARPYVPDLACDHHGGPREDQIRFVRDGDMWCAFMPDFINLAESLAGFGQTQPLAEADLHAAIAKATNPLTQIEENGFTDSPANTSCDFHPSRFRLAWRPPPMRRLLLTAMRRDAVIRRQILTLAAILALGIFAGFGEWPA